jgi:hypothetical protein
MVWKEPVMEILFKNFLEGLRKGKKSSVSIGTLRAENRTLDSRLRSSDHLSMCLEGEE